MRKSVKLVASAVVSLAAAGACLAVPAFAAERSSALSSVAGAAAQAAEQGSGQDSASDASAASADKADKTVSLGTRVTFGGLAFDVPQDYERQESGEESVAIWGNKAGTAIVAVYDLRGAEAPENGAWSDYFTQVAQASVEGFDGTAVRDLGMGTDESGLTIYGYGVDASDADGDYVIVQMFIPMDEGGFTFMQVGYTDGEASEAEIDELAGVIDSLKLASGEGLDAKGLKVSSCGLTFELPEGVSAYEGDDDSWMDEDADIIVKVVGHVVEGASKLTADDYAEIFKRLVPTGDSADSKVTALTSDTVEGQNVTSMYATYKVEDPDATMYTAVVVVPVADDSLSVVIVWCSEEGAQQYGTAITDMLESFKQRSEEAHV